MQNSLDFKHLRNFTLLGLAFFTGSGHGHKSVVVDCAPIFHKVQSQAPEFPLPQPQSDLFLSSTPRWQPKKDIAEYVSLQQQGLAKKIHVAPFFKSLPEGLQALAKGQVDELLIRSEWSGEYDGLSGLFESHSVRRNDLKVYEEALDLDATEQASQIASSMVEEFRAEDLSNLKTVLDNLERNLGGEEVRIVDFEDASKNLSYSAWQKIAGENLSIMQDSGNPDQVHIIHNKEDFSDHFIFDQQGRLIRRFYYPREGVEEESRFIKKHAPGILDFYFELKNLPAFDPSHAPIIEAQLDASGSPHFLQYHRARDIQRAAFELNGLPPKSYVRADWVRGITPREGLLLEVDYADGVLPSFEGQSALETELLAKIDAQKGQPYVDLNPKEGEMASGHMGLTRIAKPSISVGVDSNQFLSFEDKKALNLALARDSRNSPKLRLHVRSDGKQAWVRYLGHNLEQQPQMPQDQR